MQNSEVLPTAANAPASHLHTLTWNAEHSDAPRKRQRTRARLLAATARVMAAKGYVDFRVCDITAEAWMSNGAFYVYFADREEAAREVLSGLVSRLYLFDRNQGQDDDGVRLIARHLEALQCDAPLVGALCQAVLLDDVLARLHAGAVGLWRAHLCAVLLGASEAYHILKKGPRPDVLDLMIEGMARRAGAPMLTQNGLLRVAAEVAEAWRASQGQIAHSDGAQAPRSVPVQPYATPYRVA